jgi:hypothetical protein
VVEPIDRARFLGRFGTSLSEPPARIEEHDLALTLAKETLTFEDIKTLIRGARYTGGYSEMFGYANSLLPEASDYLRPHTLRALVRADMTEKEAAAYLEKNKSFFQRLVNLLPSIVGFFSKEARNRNPRGLVMTVDDCHNEFQATGNSARRDRQLREAKEKLKRASQLAREAASALDEADEHLKYEYERYRSIYYRPVPGPARFRGDLIDELRMCAGFVDITHEVADIKPKSLFLFGNDQRSDLVENVYHMCTMWDGPKLVTTPGSDFSALCSLLFEATSGHSDEGLAGAINRYARSDDRKQWDKEGEDDNPEDNFQNEKAQMWASSNAIALCKRVLLNPGLSEMATLLLNLRIKHEEKQYEEAQTKYGPRQVYISQMNQEQWEGMLIEAVNRLKPEQIDHLDDMIMNGKSMAICDVEHGQKIRADRAKGIDVKSEKARS